MIKGSLASSSSFDSSIECFKSSSDIGVSLQDPSNPLDELLVKVISALMPFVSGRFHSSQNSFQSLSGIMVSPSV